MTRFVIGALAAAVLAVAPAIAGSPVMNPKDLELVDLTHPLNGATIMWPTSPDTFRLERLHAGTTEGGYWYASNRFSSPEHGGTHLDAPVHFNEAGITVERIPLERLVAPAVVLDVSAKAAADPDYLLTREDVLAFEAAHGRIEPGTIVLVRTGWSLRWSDRRAYLGDDTPGDASRLHFPGLGEAAARLLVEERRAAAVGIDTASIDHGPSKDFRAHRVVAAAQVPALENLVDLHRLPPTGAVVAALPMKIEGGSGAPARVVALLPAQR